MAAKKSWAIVLTALITALLVGGLTYIITAQRINELQTQILGLESANSDLEAQVAALQEQMDSEQPGDIDNNGTADEEISFAPKPGWEAYFPSAEATTLLGETTAKVRSLLGEPPVLLRSTAADAANNRQIWIYRPYEEDPTGLYLYFKDGQLTGSRLDEFNGLYGSNLLDDEDFWLR